MMRAECKLCHEVMEIKERGLCQDCSVYSDEQVLKDSLMDEIKDKVREVGYKKEAFLRKYGWISSCNFPDSCWRWVKEIKGVTIAVSRDNAVRIEAEINHYKN